MDYKYDFHLGLKLIRVDCNLKDRKSDSLIRKDNITVGLTSSNSQDKEENKSVSLISIENYYRHACKYNYQGLVFKSRLNLVCGKMEGILGQEVR